MVPRNTLRLERTGQLERDLVGARRRAMAECLGALRQQCEALGAAIDVSLDGAALLRVVEQAGDEIRDRLLVGAHARVITARLQDCSYTGLDGRGRPVPRSHLWTRLGRTDAPPAALAAALAELVARARAVWPAFAVSDEELVTAAAAGMGEPPEVVAAVRQLHAADLLLALACLHEFPDAIAAVERQLIARVPAFIRDIDRSEAFADEVTQLVRLKLWVDDGRPAKLRQYTGRGALDSWVCTVAIRTALMLLRSGQRAEVQPREELPIAAADGDPELELVRQEHLDEFRQAVRQAVAALESQERNLLRLYFIERITLQQLGVMHGMHASTVMRRLREIRGLVLDETRRRLREQLRLSPSEFDSLANLLQSRLESDAERRAGDPGLKRHRRAAATSRVSCRSGRS